MGNAGSSLVDCVQDFDTQGVKAQLSSRVADVEDGEMTDEEFHSELEDAVHTALSMEITTPHQYQQLQIALELLLHVAPTALQTSECNNARWTGIHRACVTGNLSFVAFLVHRYAPYISTERDAFGLLPLDLVPPELSSIGATSPPLTETSLKSLPSTERERIELALQILRKGKADAQRVSVQSYLKANGTVTNQADGENEKTKLDYFIAFEPTRERLSPDLPGCVHQSDLPLRLRYHLPRAEPFFYGYFQLVWRSDEDPRSVEPNYENHILLRDSIDLDHAADPEDLVSNQRETRQLYDDDKRSDESGVLTGSVPIDVSHLADDVVCHVLFVASDKSLMKREIVLSTEGVRLVRPDPLDVGTMLANQDYEQPYEYDPESDADADGFLFHVAGEAFTHPSEDLAGRTFETLDEFETFVKALRAAKQKQEEDDEPVLGDKDDAVRRASVLSNQDDVDDEQKDEHGDDVVLVSRELQRSGLGGEKGNQEDSEDEWQA